MTTGEPQAIAMTTNRRGPGGDALELPDPILAIRAYGQSLPLRRF